MSSIEQVVPIRGSPLDPGVWGCNLSYLYYSSFYLMNTTRLTNHIMTTQTLLSSLETWERLGIPGFLTFFFGWVGGWTCWVSVMSHVPYIYICIHSHLHYTYHIPAPHICMLSRSTTIQFVVPNQLYLPENKQLPSHPPFSNSLMEAKHVFVFEHHRNDPFMFIIASYMSSFSWFYIRNQQKVQTTSLWIYPSASTRIFLSFVCRKSLKYVNLQICSWGLMGARYKSIHIRWHTAIPCRWPTLVWHAWHSPINVLWSLLGSSFFFWKRWFCSCDMLKLRGFCFVDERISQVFVWGKWTKIMHIYIYICIHFSNICIYSIDVCFFKKDMISMM